MPMKTIKRSVSFSDKVNNWAEEMADAKGFDNFSAYIADLVRRDKEREEAERSGKGIAASVGPIVETRSSALNEPPTTYKTPRK